MGTAQTRSLRVRLNAESTCLALFMSVLGIPGAAVVRKQPELHERGKAASFGVSGMSMRKSLSRTLRFEVFKRDKFTCQYCGRTPPSVILEADHIVPVSKGGQNESLNLVTACEDCNRGKSDKQLSSVIPSRAAEIKRKREQLDQTREYNDFLMEVRNSELRMIEEIGSYWFEWFLPGQNLIFGDARVPSIRNFLKRLVTAEIYDAIDIAMSRVPPIRNEDWQTFRYFCKVCWNKIKDRGAGAMENRVSQIAGEARGV